ncbi:uncharacterized protein RHO25_010125 [Cercospora beticola]|uniref:Uncharacterized protein n=1 Tax=Cercospora beticola TaxID=122368 RepID=A0ABZ0P147_CERBT|nr:hypothetical protein RHO25_010125 [Cercospora beticola]CAK1365287.1 unnamed protein product [Cercospora beticola]
MFSASNHDSDLYEEPPPSPMPEDIAPMPEEQRESVSALLSHADQSARSVGDPEEHEALPDRATDDGPFVALESRREKYAKIVVAHWGKKWHRSLRAQKIISKKVGHAGLSVTVIKHLAIMAFWIPDQQSAIVSLRKAIASRLGDPAKRNKAAQLSANDVKLVLEAMEEVKGKTWNELANKALRESEQ